MVFSTDIDECNENPGSDNSDNCNLHATCTNTVGSFTCACNTGYSGNGVDCTGMLYKSGEMKRWSKPHVTLTLKPL